jgi:hypothetical protein
VQATSQLVKAMLQLLKENDTLLARKRLYVEMGCRWVVGVRPLSRHVRESLGVGCNRVARPDATN